jgi:hypothetical protein
VRAAESGGRWIARVTLRRGELALVQAGGVRDRFDQINAKASEVVGTGTTAARRKADQLAKTTGDC